MPNFDDKDLAMICATVTALIALFLVKDPVMVFSHLLTCLGSLAVGTKLK